MPVEISIAENDINYIEKILLPNNKQFDEERKTFIKDLTTLDLQAVPGSGKTTALLGKLIILDKYMPFKDGSGILVISHTNSAVNEIKEKIGKYCSHLFTYPNFVGTIQSFVDEFLAAPYYSIKYKKKLIRIDNEIYLENAKNFSMMLFKGFNPQEQNNAKRYLHSNDLFKRIRVTHNETSIDLTEGYFGKRLDYTKPIANTKPQNYQDWNQGEKDKIKEWLYCYKKRLFTQGVLCFDDAYFFAFEYLKRLPKVKTIIQKRFNYVFVDEMQDMDIHQHEILEQLFFDNGKSQSNFQRIGDKNQAIFNGDAKLEEIWSIRSKTLLINGSHRLNSKIAPIVTNLALTPNYIEGRGLNYDNSEIKIKPHLIIFDDLTQTSVINEFARIIKDNQDLGLIPISPKNKFMAIGWRKENDDPSKLSLTSYWSNFSAEEHKTSIDYNVLKDYLLFYNKEKHTLESVRKNILNSFLQILRKESVLDANERFYTKRSLLSKLENANIAEYESFKLFLYKCSIGIIRGQFDPVFSKIQEYLPIFLKYFGKETITCNDFIIGEPQISPQQVQDFKIKSNTFNLDNIEVKVGTVHSAKGQTHTATLYLETFYERGYGNYESQRLRNQIKDIKLSDTLKELQAGHDKVRKSAKMAYVGFSRPTHLLCFAIHINRFNECLLDINQDVWNVIDITKHKKLSIKAKVQFPNANKQPKPLF
jgi:DNA helicase-2/ATP-dependent DNA helicase PcrA